MMKWDVYKQEARKTAIYPAHIGQFYVPMKLTGEIAELDRAIEGDVRAEIAAELADVCWYLAALEFELGLETLNLDDAAIATKLMPGGTTEDMINRLYRHVADINQHIAKANRGDGVISNTRMAMIQTAYYSIFTGLLWLCWRYDFDIGMILQQNIVELNGRADAGTLHGDGHGEGRQSAE